MSQIRKKPDEEIPDLAGQLICKWYKLKKVVGQGAHGMVYIGKDLSTDTDIAAKMVSNLN